VFTSNEVEHRESLDGGVPLAWVWSQYRGELAPNRPERETSSRTVALLNAKGADSGAVAIGVVLAIVIIAGLTWLLASGAISMSKQTPQAGTTKFSLFGPWV
jgi:hypothetical protein